MTTARTLLLALSLAALPFAPMLTGPAVAAEYPTSTIHIVIPWKAGGGTDAIGRGFAEALKAVVGVAVVIDNIDGAGGMTGSIKVAKGKPDGYSLLLNGSSDMTSALTFQEFPLSLDDYTYIGGIYVSPTWMLAHKDRGYRDLADFLAKAKAQPGKLTVGTAGPAGAQMLMAAGIKGMTGADFRIIPYSGGNDLKKAMFGNQVDAGIIHSPVMLPEIREGMVGVLATGEPLTQLMYEPLRKTRTLREFGIAMDIGITRGVFVAKGTPKNVTDRLSALCEQTAKSEAFRKFGEQFGFLPVWMPGSQFETLMKTELSLFREIKAKYISK